jgi:hypothetical protein
MLEALVHLEEIVIATTAGHRFRSGPEMER